MLARLKQFLKDQKLDFLLLPNSDQFFSEYLPENEKRIEWLTGFTGSNATVIFGQEKSYFFTDGRYILQAKNQLDLSEFEIFNLAETPLLSKIPTGAKLGVDPALTSVTFAKNLQKKFPLIEFVETAEIFSSKQKHLAATNSAKSYFSLSDKVTGTDSETKIAQLLQDLGTDAILITKPENICWLLNIRGRDLEFTPIFLTYAILTKNGEITLFRDQIPDLKNKIKSIQIDESSTNYWLHRQLEKGGFELVNKNDPIDLLKSPKNPTEIFGAIKAHEEDGLAVTKFLFWLSQQSESDEISAAKKLLEFRQESPNFFSESFAAISGFASNGAIIHYHSTNETNKKISGDSLYLIDSGGQYLGEDFCGTTDITRTVAIGNPSAEMIENFTRVLKGHIAIARAKFPRGTSGAQLDILAREHLWRAELNYDHGTGHGVGSFLSVHEGPCAISKRGHQELLCGMILSNEPGFYKDGEYGIRIENLLLIEESEQKNFIQFRTLTLAPIDPKLIDFKMLTYPEKKWLASYHNEILQKFSGRLDGKNFDWLSAIAKTFLEKL